VVIPNSINTARFDRADASARLELERLYSRPPSLIVGAAGRLSPEKGFHILIDAAVIVANANPSIGFIIFGDGALRDTLQRRIDKHGLGDRFVLAGFRRDLDRFLPKFDLMVQSSFTEGMPNVVLEACAAGVPVVATAVGGTPEIVEPGVNGHLISPGDPASLAQKILESLDGEQRRREMGRRGRQIVSERFTFAAQGELYRQLFQVLPLRTPGIPASVSSLR
jgi:glycosyltransferase involved in cell wall biosynthesis